MSREVHGGLIQTAITAYMRLQAFFDDHPPGSTVGDGELDLPLELVRRMVEEARRVIEGLRPAALDDFGLAAALQLLVEELRPDGWRVDYEEDLGTERLPDETETALYRVAQEALTNARKHAKTTSAHVRLGRRGTKVRLEVRDFGRGFEHSATPEGSGPGEKVGISGMRQRITLLSGDFKARSRPGQGTTWWRRSRYLPPRERTPDVEPETPPYRMPSPTTTSPSGRGRVPRWRAGCSGNCKKNREEQRWGGVVGLARLWARVALDLTLTVVTERMDDRKLASHREVKVNERRLALAGVALLSAPLFFVAASLLKYELGIGFLFEPLEALLSDPQRLRVFNLVSPVVFLGGLGLALALNAYAVLRLNVGREDGAIVGTVRVQVRFWNIAVTAASLLLLVTLVGYFFVENFVYRP